MSNITAIVQHLFDLQEKMRNIEEKIDKILEALPQPKYIKNDLQLECPQCGWVSEKFKVKK